MTLDTEVIVVGGGPVGLGLATELALHGVRAVLIERRTDPSVQPRAKLTNLRSMALLRRWGLADEVRRRAPLPDGYPSDIVFCTRMTGWLLARFDNALSTAATPDAPYAEPAQQIPQTVLEEVLRTQLMGAPTVEVRIGTSVVDLRQSEDRAEVLLDTGEQLTCSYIVGCDGSQSTVRRGTGISMNGGAPLATNVGIVFRAPDLHAMHDLGRAVHYWTINPEMPAILGPLDAEDGWWFHATAVDPSTDVKSIDAHSWLIAAVGKRFDAEILAVDPWIAHRVVAQDYRRGRVFLAGDAAHLHPPMGGYGMNLGIGDAVDLGWKLAARLRGWGGEAILDSYQTERQSLAHRVIRESVDNYRILGNNLSAPNIERADATGDRARQEAARRIKENKRKEFSSTGLQLGYRYDHSPLIVSDGTPPPPLDVGRLAPTARPGHLLPHQWIEEGVALADLLKASSFTLLRCGADADVAGLVKDAERRSIPLTVVALDLDSDDRALLGAPLVLVRPDQHVAWRGHSISDPTGLLNRVTGTTVVGPAGADGQAGANGRAAAHGQAGSERRQAWVIRWAAQVPAAELMPLLPQHHAYRRRLIEAGALLGTRPFGSADAAVDDHSVWLVIASTAEEAERLTAAEPWAAAGLRRCTLQAWALVTAAVPGGTSPSSLNRSGRNGQCVQ